MYRLLSYPLSADTPLYGDTEPVKIDLKQQALEGDSCITTARVSFSNHSGTHVDAPRHFFRNGKALDAYSIEELVFTSPRLIDCPKNDGELISCEDLKSLTPGCDLLLLRTGSYKKRGDEVYRLNNPGIAPEAAEWIRSSRPSVRAVGIDTISVSAYQNRQAGRRTHQAFLKDKGFPGKPVLLIEDMDLAGNIEELRKVYVVPLFFQGIDSMACTVIGECQ